MNNITRKDKRAVSHIEMAISFAMFVMFVFFLLFYLKPTRSQNISEVMMDAVANGLEKNGTVQLIEIPLTLKAAVAENCFTLENPYEASSINYMFVRDEDEKALKFSFSGDDINIEKSREFYYLFFSEDGEFESMGLPSPPCMVLNEGDYEYAAAKTYKLFSLPRLEAIKQRYDYNYLKLKEDFNYPPNYDFAIKITLLATQQSILSMESNKPEKVEVIAREMPIEILQRDGSILRAIVNIQVW